MRPRDATLAPKEHALTLVDRRYVCPSFKTRRRELGFEVLRRILGRENYERVRSWRRHGRMPNLKAPVRFNEKVSARKLYEDIPDAVTMSDKVAVRSFVASRVGERYLKELYQVVSDTADIDFDQLPEAFVAKANHGSTMSIFVSQKSATDLESVRDLLAVFLRRKVGRIKNEWWYDKFTPQILFEQYVDTKIDYRLWVYHGVVQLIFAVHFQTDAATVYDRNWQPQSFGARNGGCDIPRPPRLDEMIEVAEAVSSGLPFLRVDLFSPGDREVVFGEVALAPGSGWSKRTETGDTIEGSFW